jgi:hypothetical protein
MDLYDVSYSDPANVGRGRARRCVARHWPSQVLGLSTSCATAGGQTNAPLLFAASARVLTCAALATVRSRRGACASNACGSGSAAPTLLCDCQKIKNYSIAYRHGQRSIATRRLGSLPKAPLQRRASACATLSSCEFVRVRQLPRPFLFSLVRAGGRRCRRVPPPCLPGSSAVARPSNSRQHRSADSISKQSTPSRQIQVRRLVSAGSALAHEPTRPLGNCR